MNITLIGMPGAGKSFIGAKLARVLGYELIELDRLMEERFGTSLQQVLDTLGEARFLEEQEHDAVRYTAVPDRLVISPGGSIVYTSGAMEQLKRISKIVYLKTSFEIIEKRVAETPRGIVGLKRKTLRELYDERTALYEKWADFVIEGEQEVDMVVETVLEQLNG